MILNKYFGVLSLLVLALPWTAAANNSRSLTLSFPNGVASGDTTHDSTILWTRSAVKGVLQFEVFHKGNLKVKEDVLVEDVNKPVKLKVKQLDPDRNYDFKVTGPDGKAITGHFKTAARGTKPVGLSFGVTGDWRGELAPYPAIKNANGLNLDFFLKLGDTIYADIASPAEPNGQAKTLAEYRAKHQEAYSYHNGLNSFARLQRNVSIFSTIDDHEVINDFSGGALASTDPRFGESTGLINQTELYRNGIQAFFEYNAISDRRYKTEGDLLTDGRPDLYRMQRYGRTAGIYILDARSFRDQDLPGVGNITDPLQIGAFIAQSFDAGLDHTRTMLGKKQLDRLKADLLTAQQDGVLWKFVAVPEPIQNLGVLGASDRFEGYASERSELLGFIDDNHIKNVVFVAADIHGTIINDLSYQKRSDVLQAIAATGNPLSAPQRPTSAFEVTTGSVAFYPAFGDAVLDLLTVIPGGKAILDQLLAATGVANLEEFRKLPMAVKNSAMEGLINQQISGLGYSKIGLQDNNLIKAALKQGGNTALFSFGWTRFDIASHDQTLKITTYGIEPYNKESLVNHSAEIIARKPAIVSQLVISPQR